MGETQGIVSFNEKGRTRFLIECSGGLPKIDDVPRNQASQTRRRKKTWKLETQGEETGSQPTSHEDQPIIVAILSTRHWAAEHHFLALC